MVSCSAGWSLGTSSCVRGAQQKGRAVPTPEDLVSPKCGG